MPTHYHEVERLAGGDPELLIQDLLSQDACLSAIEADISRRLGPGWQVTLGQPVIYEVEGEPTLVKLAGLVYAINTTGLAEAGWP